jgi:hypothetical protein
MFNVNRASPNSIINRVMSNANGIGISKSEQRNISNIVGENGHKVSDLAHSVKSVQNLRSVTVQYIDHVKNNFDGKVAGNINAESAKSFLEAKALTVNGGTLNTYVSGMNKLSDNLNKDNIGSLSRSDIRDIKNELKESHDLNSKHINRAYENPESIKYEMENSPLSLSADLQHEAGMRVGDSLDSSKWTINQDNSIYVEKSKNGVNYTTKELSQETINKVENAINANYKGNYTEYKNDLKEAVERSGQVWEKHGSHGLRYGFAQERYEDLKAEGSSNDEAKSQTSLEMGHSRISITDHYLS